MIVDKQGRRFRNLRVSLTSACNYACTYCVPDGKRLVAQRDALPVDKLVTAVTYLKQATDLEKLRITGGEPLISPLFDGFLAAISQLGLQDVSLTTNGQLLERKLPVLLAGGVRRINVSLDSLDAAAFRRIARGGDLAEVLRGIEAALDAGVQVKINMVPLRGHNHEQVLPLLDYCLARGIELRFIELMRMGHLARDATAFRQQFYGMPEILERIAERYTYRQAETALDATAQRFEIPGQGYFGIIANESAPFCRTCSRLRLTSNGWLYGCLSSSQRHFIGDLLDTPYEQALPALQARLQGALADKQDVAFAGDVMVMKIIGG
ncbi:GTP 3',8-cyclase MoaA [Pseudomonas sp.]|uniref:GTP 3',8-cyclase MoaA n=1 Tax=Pseudomonas sp. TaxID=306 RepID=UPI003D0AC6EC